ncbi:WD repeat domain-containing protein [Tetrabaena socialis]|uniref:WD repeat domain-containing protein n=1 Tax=Tetrabaena socialis TaxID=47790 RepID=A0A2J8AEG3_9CHLO|nr:WD repeat domain-containing protein [Tetrabaena socialis]|eukprot:PNH10915.1 WD repeat domain-containing protein [Tetrabaena socialis]
MAPNRLPSEPGVALRWTSLPGQSASTLELEWRGAPPGGRRAATQHHEPAALFAALSVCLARDAPANVTTASPASAAPAAQPAGRRHTQAAAPAVAGADGADGGGRRQLLCALTGTALQPEDVVLLLPAPGPAPGPGPVTAGGGKGGARAGSKAGRAAAEGQAVDSAGVPGVLAVQLEAGVGLLRPLLAAVAVGGEGAAARVRGLDSLPEPQHTRAAAALAAAAAAEEEGAEGAVAPAGGPPPAIPTGSGSGSPAASGPVVAAAVDARMGLEAAQPPPKRQRRSPGPAEEGGQAAAAAAEPPAPPPPRRSARGATAAVAATAPPPPPLPPAHARAAAAAVHPVQHAAAAAANAAAGSSPSVVQMLDLDRERAERMERNRRMLLQLHLPALVEEAAAAARAEVAGGKATRHASQRGVGGKSLPFRSDNGGEDGASDAAFLANLRAWAAAGAASAPPHGQGAGRGAGGRALAKLGLANGDVAKVTKDGVTHLAWLPGSERLLLAAGDKGGRVSLWDVEGQESGAAADTDGVLMFSPHGEYVSGMRWLGREAAVGPCRLITASYDGSLRKINTLHLEPSSCQLLASSASDGTVCIWDVRRLDAAAAAAGAGGGGGGKGGKGQAKECKALCVLRHAKSCHAAYWAHDGSKRLLSTSYDDTVRIWADPGAGGAAADGRHHCQRLSIHHNNQTGRWITPFRRAEAAWRAGGGRAVWSAQCDAVVVGSMRRGLDLFQADDPGAGAASAGGGGQLLASLSSEHLTAIPSRAAPHPLLPALVAATSSGRCHVWR